MRARIDDFWFGDGKLIARVGFYFDEDEEGFKTPSLIKKIVKKAEQKPFLTLSFPTDYKAGLDDLKVSILGQLNAFKSAHSKLPNYQDWIGTELEDTL